MTSKHLLSNCIRVTSCFHLNVPIINLVLLETKRKCVEIEGGKREKHFFIVNVNVFRFCLCTESIGYVYAFDRVYVCVYVCVCACACVCVYLCVCGVCACV